MKTKGSKLDDILSMITYDGTYTPDGLPEAKEDIKNLMLELVGDNLPPLPRQMAKDLGFSLTLWETHSIMQNQLKDDLRKRVKDL